VAFALHLIGRVHAPTTPASSGICVQGALAATCPPSAEEVEKVMRRLGAPPRTVGEGPKVTVLELCSLVVSCIYYHKLTLLVCALTDAYSYIAVPFLLGQEAVMIVRSCRPGYDLCTVSQWSYHRPIFAVSINVGCRSLKVVRLKRAFSTDTGSV